jgi:hypothetical protein
VFDADQYFLNRKRTGFGGKRVERRSIAQLGLRLSQPFCCVVWLSCEYLLRTGGEASNSHRLVCLFWG